MISLIAPKPHVAMEHCQMFNARRTSWLNPAYEHLFDAGYRDLDYTYDPPRQDYEPGRLVRSPEERNFRVIGAVNQRLQPVPQKMSTTTSGAINRIFYHRICDYNAVSGVFIWLNDDPIGEVGGIYLFNFVRNNPVDSLDFFGLYLVDSPFPVTISVPGYLTNTYNSEQTKGATAGPGNNPPAFFSNNKGSSCSNNVLTLPPLKTVSQTNSPPANNTTNKPPTIFPGFKLHVT
jgi:hypothetical protein